MRKRFITFLAIMVCAVLCCTLSACSTEPADGNTVFPDVTVEVGDTATLTPEFLASLGGEATYSLAGDVDAITIEDNVITAVKEGTVAVTASNGTASITFNVIVVPSTDPAPGPSTPGTQVDYGDMTIDDYKVDVNVPTTITPEFTKPAGESAVTYTVTEGTGITITDGVITATVPGATISVMAQSAHHIAFFTVSAYDRGEITIPNVVVEAGGTATIAPVFSTPDGNSELTYTFDGNNFSITGNTVTGLVKGTVTTVTATTDYHTTTFTVTVPDRGALSIADVKLDSGAANEVTLSPEFTTEEGVSTVRYSYEGSNIYISGGKVMGLVKGTTTTVTATTDYHTTTFTVYVYNRGALSVPNMQLDANESKTPVLNFTTEDGESTPQYSFEGNNISIDNGEVTGLVQGTTTTVTVTTPYHTATFMVYVYNRGTITIAEQSVNEGASVRVTPVISSNADGVFASDVTYVSNNTAIATVTEDGLITGVAPGETTITATTKYGHSVTFDVTVIASDRGMLTIGNKIMQVDASAAVTPVFSLPEHKNKITYSFSGSVVSIDDKGNDDPADDTITANSVGTVVVTANTPYHTTTFNVEVIQALGTLSFKLPAPRYEETVETQYAAQADGSTNILYTNYDPRPITATFENNYWSNMNPQITYTTNNNKVKVGTKNGKFGLYAEGSFSTAVQVTVTATTVYGHSASRTYWVKNFEGSGGALFSNGQIATKDSLSFESSKISDRLSRWQKRGGDKGGVVFIGDSFMDRSYWSDFDTTFANKNVHTMGVSSSTTTDWEIVAERMLYPLEPKVVVMHCGTNNIWDDDPIVGNYKNANTTYNDIVRLLEQMHENLPNAVIYVYGIEPRTYIVSNNTTAQNVNSMLKSYMNGKAWVNYIDSPAWCYANGADGSGAVVSGFFRDGVHPTLANYSKYVQALTNAGVVFENSETIYNNTTVEDYNVTTLGSAAYKDIYYRGTPIKNDYVLTGKMHITSKGNNAHAHFVFNTYENRFLLWDSNNNGKFGAGWAIGGNHTNDVGYDNYATGDIYFRIIVNGTKAYFYLGTGLDTLNLELVWVDVPIAGNMKIGAEQMVVSYTNMTVKTKADDLAEYNALVNKYAISAGNTAGVTRQAQITGKGESDTTNYSASNPRDLAIYRNGSTAFTGNFKLSYTAKVLNHTTTGTNWFSLITVSTDATLNSWSDYHVCYRNGSISSLSDSLGTAITATPVTGDTVEVEVQRSGSTTVIRMRAKGTTTWVEKTCTGAGTGTLYLFFSHADCTVQLSNLIVE